MLVDITQISAIVAAGGVIIGVVFTVLELRHLYHNPGFFEWFEYLYAEMKKREQLGIKNG
jgi:hypothetical protein